nr:hypothetical protein [Mycobacterium pseudoshottsii]
MARQFIVARWPPSGSVSKHPARGPRLRRDAPALDAGIHHCRHRTSSALRPTIHHSCPNVLTGSDDIATTIRRRNRQQKQPRPPALLISRLVSWVDDLWCRAIGAGV